MSKEDKQQLYNKNVREMRNLGITSRFTAFLMYRCDLEAKEAELSPRNNQKEMAQQSHKNNKQVIDKHNLKKE